MNAKAKASARRPRRFRPVFVVALQIVAFAGCTPWTIRPIDDGSNANTTSQRIDPAAYVDSIWNSKLTPQILNSAVDARTLLSAMTSSPDDARQKYGRNVGGRWYFTVKGQGKVLVVDTSSRAGVLNITVTPQSPHTDVTIQIGPILRGSALRDSTDLVPFSNFVNQVDFADAADDLNKKADQTVLASLDAKALVGKTIQFAGAFEMNTLVSQPAIKGVIPVQLFPVNSQ